MSCFLQFEVWGLGFRVYGLENLQAKLGVPGLKITFTILFTVSVSMV